jgi:branched-chain amino acid transport system ATP-binding protein
MKMKAQKILEDLDLLQYAYQYPLGLPYGILKKIELARTLMVNPKLIILDEPAAGLNDAETDALATTIYKIRDEYKTTIFLVEHDMSLVMKICDTVCAISFGKKLAIGTPKEIQSSKVVREAYLGGE